MSSKIKLKIRNPKDGHQRTNTDYMEPRKPNILTNKTLTMVNKKVINLSQQGQVKKQKVATNGQTKYSNKSSITMSKLAT